MYFIKNIYFHCLVCINSDSYSSREGITTAHLAILRLVGVME